MGGREARRQSLENYSERGRRTVENGKRENTENRKYRITKQSWARKQRTDRRDNVEEWTKWAERWFTVSSTNEKKTSGRGKHAEKLKLKLKLFIKTTAKIMSR